MIALCVSGKDDETLFRGVLADLRTWQMASLNPYIVASLVALFAALNINGLFFLLYLTINIAFLVIGIAVVQSFYIIRLTAKRTFFCGVRSCKLIKNRFPTKSVGDTAGKAPM